MIALAVVGWPGALSQAAAAEPWDLRIRLAWGSGSPEVWRGALRVTAGTLSEVMPLGLEPDAAAAFFLDGSSVVRIEPRLPRIYDGCDVRVQAPADARLIVELAAGPEGQVTPLELPLAQLATEFLQFSLDQRGNRLFA